MDVTRSYRLPNSIIAARIVLAFVASVLLVQGSLMAAAAAVFLTLLAMFMDALDGITARRLGLSSTLGGILDITADRIVEHVYWITFAVLQRVPLWVPLVIATRGVLVDAVRGLALARGRTAFGDSTMARFPMTRFLTASGVMRAAYGVAKVTAFVLLGTLVALGDSQVAEASAIAPRALAVLEGAATAAVLTAVAICVARGIPVILDGLSYLDPDGGRPAIRSIPTP